MTLAGQRVQPDRYTVIPRTITFLVRGDSVLLIRIASGRGAWAGKLNGVGGHIERGESPAAAARREVFEETGVKPGELKLCGVVLVDAGTPGIGLYVFVGEPVSAGIKAGPEGAPEWVPLAALPEQDLVADLPQLLPHAIASYADDHAFSALTRFDANGDPILHFDP